MIPEQIVVNSLLTSYVKIVTEENSVPIIFLHGWGSSKEVWGEVMKFLQINNISSYALDLPGFGGTSAPPAPWTVESYADFTAQFMQKLKIPAAIVVGHSFGGRVALVLSSKHRFLVTKLVLVDSAGVYTHAAGKKLLGVVAKFVKPFFRWRWTGPLRKKIYRTLGAADYVATPELNKTFVLVIGEDLTKYLKLIQQPSLILWGGNDLVTPLSYAQHFAERLPGARLIILPRAGHYSFLDAPPEFNSALIKFISQK